MKHFETEFKWDANTPRAFARMRGAWRRVPGLKHTAPKKLHICDVYLDTPAGDLARELIALRVRCTDGKWEATYKTRTAMVNEKAVRREETLPLPGVQKRADALAVLANKKMWQGVPLQGLKALFEIRNRRQTVNLFYDGATAEMAFDAFEIRVAGRRVLMKEIELEHKQGRVERTEQLAQELTRESGLTYAKISKVKTAGELLKLWGDK